MKCLVLLSLLAPALAGCQNEQRPPAAGATPSFYASMARTDAAVDGPTAVTLPELAAGGWVVTVTTPDGSAREAAQRRNDMSEYGCPWTACGSKIC